MDSGFPEGEHNSERTMCSKTTSCSWLHNNFPRKRHCEGLLSETKLTFNIVGVSWTNPAKRAGNEDDVINVGHVVTQELGAITVSLFHTCGQGLNGRMSKNIFCQQSEWFTWKRKMNQLKLSSGLTKNMTFGIGKLHDLNKSHVGLKFLASTKWFTTESHLKCKWHHAIMKTIISAWLKTRTKACLSACKNRPCKVMPYFHDLRNTGAHSWIKFSYHSSLSLIFKSLNIIYISFDSKRRHAHACFFFFFCMWIEESKWWLNLFQYSYIMTEGTFLLQVAN